MEYKPLTLEEFQRVLGKEDYEDLFGSFDETQFYKLLDDNNFDPDVIKRQKLKKVLKSIGFFEGSFKGTFHYRKYNFILAETPVATRTQTSTFDPSVEMEGILHTSAPCPDFKDLPDFIRQPFPENCKIPISRSRYNRLHDELNITETDLTKYTIFKSSF
jgi:hypothetical protein